MYGLGKFFSSDLYFLILSVGDLPRESPESTFQVTTEEQRVSVGWVYTVMSLPRYPRDLSTFRLAAL